MTVRWNVTSRLLLICASLASAAGAEMRACSLLTAGELGAAGGGEVSATVENFMPISEGASKGVTMGICMWQVGETMISLGVVSSPQGADRAAGLAQLEEISTELRSKGWKEERRELGGARCSAMTPPPSDKDAPLMSSCLAEAKGMVISVTALGRRLLAIEKVKTLLDAAFVRLP
jgi:hypothetical protein